MRHAENVTFGGSALNRAAELRGPEAQAVLQAHPAAKTTLFWRGKPLVQDQVEGVLGLAWVDLDHPALGSAAESLIFLGLNEAKEPLFLADISIWEPEELPETLNAFLDPSQQEHPALKDGEYFAELRAVMTQLSARDAELAATGRGFWNGTAPMGFAPHVARPPIWRWPAGSVTARLATAHIFREQIRLLSC
jgi:NAD+ diphosphatase